MEFPGILDLHKNPNEDVARPAFFLDLNIDQIIERIDREWGEEVKSYFYFPADRESEDYRRKVCYDIKQAGLFEPLCAFRNKMLDTVRCSEYREESVLSLQKAVWAICEATGYCEALSGLKAALEAANSQGLLQSEGMTMLFGFLQDYMAGGEYQTLLVESRKLLDELNSLRIRMTYENNRVAVEAVDVKDAKELAPYEQFLRFFYKDNPKNLVTPFDDTVDLTKLERSVLAIFVKRRPEFFEAAERFEKSHRDFICKEFKQLTDDLSFYLSFRKFEIKLEKKGLCFCSPTVEEDKIIRAEGLYDFALACSMLDTLTQGSESVVANDFYYNNDEQFFVLTGPNQGGKTTFARSLGQLVYFTKMGLEVAAVSANLHYFEDILTHFSVEESVETGRGKLKEELIRLAPMMEAKYDKSFVIINELFTTAANYDAIIMGTNVLQHFIKQFCTGIYVTHLHELCEADKAVTGICAMLDENGKQSFKISRENIDYAECAANQVNKHRLGYEQLKSRLGGLNG
ncbi:MAG: hypothetical protein MJ131_09590 [Lachnospiraceae bacterium]|nr:hypothetical protein [Lachnospiraceae bacterium]